MSNTQSVADRLLYKLYLSTMRYESMAMLPVRRWILNRLLKMNRRKLNVHAHVFIHGWWGLNLGENVTINRGCSLAAHGGLSIGDDTMLAPNAQVWTTGHGKARNQLIFEQPLSFHPVTIGSDVWIGAATTILASIPDGTIVGAGSVVTKPITGTYTIVAGNPVRGIGAR